MRFRFRLTSLLRLRTMREELDRERLQFAQFQARQAETALQELRQRESQSRESFLGSGVTIAGTQLQFLQQCIVVGAKAEESARVRQEAARKVRDEQRLRYEKAHRDSAVLEKLKERQRKRFQELETRRQQQRLDEAFTLTISGKTRQGLPSE